MFTAGGWLVGMSRSFGLVDSKVQEAEYFLDRILEADHFFFGVQCDAVAFAASGRSVTFAMQSSLTGNPDFDDWYALKQRELRNDPLARFFHDFRRISQHVGDNAVVGGSFRDKKAIFHFGSIPEVTSVPTLDVASACTEYFKLVLELVYECYLAFNPTINAQWRFTAEHFHHIGKTIEDAEQELGFPRGYTGGSGLDETTRWFLLRREADGCNLQRQFERWLGKRVPHPDDQA
jgi:hypothetical protein